jgi:copper homeostasis protein (lipoprotein)
MHTVFKVLAVLLALCVSQAGFAGGGTLTGTVAFRDKGEVPPGAILTVTLVDVSRGIEAPARKIGEASYTNLGRPPHPFTISYRPEDVRPSGVYVLRAELESGGRVLFRSRGLLRVLSRGAPSVAKLWLARTDDPAGGGAGGLRLPASFGGDLPCRTCEDVRYRLNLWPDNTYHLRRVWEGKGMRRDSIGRWSVDRLTHRLTLRGDEEQLEFDVLPPARLRLVAKDESGRPEDNVLTASPSFLSFEPQLPLRGMVTWTGERANFVECLTGRSYPVVKEADYDSLEHAYLATGVEPGAAIMASFDGSILENRAGAVSVERFVGVWPGETCERAASPATLRNTYWRILRLGESDVAATENRREPSLILRDGEPRFSATVGCNPLTGRFSAEGDGLRFGEVVGPRMGCPAALDDLEGELVLALQSTARWRISGQSLELLDPTGARVALLQAIHLY